MAGRPACSRTPSAAATSCGTSAGSVSGASSTSQTPSGYVSSTSAATCSARRVLPAPPVPTSVSKDVAASSRLTSAISCSRPTKLVSWRGRLFGSTSSERSGGNSAGRSGAVT